MFGFGKKNKLRKDLPPICINRKQEKGLFGRTKLVPVSKREQRKIKKILSEKYPDRYFVDDLNEWNSVKKDNLAWIDRTEEYLAATEEFDTF